MQARWMGEARAARASGAVRTAKMRAALQRKLRPAGRKLAKLALVSQQAPGSAKLAAAEAGQEFGAWMKTWHQKHPGASLVEEQVSWDARKNELSRIAAWEAHQERRMTMKTEELQRPMSGNQPVAPGATIESSTVAAGGGADETTETPEEKAAQEQEHAEAKVEAGVSENVAEEDREESTPASSSSYGNSGWGPTEAPEESPLSPEERIAQARKEIAESHTAPHNPARAEYMEHKAYWARAKAHMADEPCVPATFWYEGSIDPRPKCKKAAPVLNYEPQKALPPAPVVGPFEGEDEQERMAEPTVLGVPDGPPDFNGDSAVIAHHPFMGWQPTDLEERGGETRGSFSVVSAPSGFDNEGDVQLAIYGPPKTPIGCKIRGYRKLSGDFQGNVISTGFSQSWQSLGQIQTGPISPGVTNEYDIITCRDQKVCVCGGGQGCVCVCVCVCV